MMIKFSDIPPELKIDIEQEICSFIDSLENEPEGPDSTQRRWVKEKVRSTLYDQFGSMAIKSSFYAGALFALNNIISVVPKESTEAKHP